MTTYSFRGISSATIHKHIKEDGLHTAIIKSCLAHTDSNKVCSAYTRENKMKYFEEKKNLLSDARNS